MGWCLMVKNNVTSSPQRVNSYVHLLVVRNHALNLLLHVLHDSHLSTIVHPVYRSPLMSRGAVASLDMASIVNGFPSCLLEVSDTTVRCIGRIAFSLIFQNMISFVSDGSHYEDTRFICLTPWRRILFLQALASTSDMVPSPTSFFV